MSTPHLTKREREVLVRLAEGDTDEVLGIRLGISPHTVKFHTHRLFAKLEATGRAHAVAIGFRRGLLT